MSATVTTTNETVHTDVECRRCGGTGRVSRREVTDGLRVVSVHDCPTCRGSGVGLVPSESPFPDRPNRCPVCNGLGRVKGGKPCADCDSLGWIASPKGTPE